MITYSVYIKSHCEMPDFETTYTSTQLKGRKCLIPYADEVDEWGRVYPIRCCGKLIRLNNGNYECQSCKVIYQKNGNNI
jgi:hypothetical protein